MKIIVALGNPGNKYSNTRHNAGFIFADKLAEKLSCSFSMENKFKAEIAKGEYNTQAVWIIKPQTFMNLSGESLRAFINFYKTDISDFLIVFDDISLPLSTIRFKANGSSGGHNGIKSIIQHISTDKFDRLKIGIGPQPTFMKSEDFVLGQFSSDERKTLDETMAKAIEGTLFLIDNDLYQAQNKYNK
ncbi:aminoacyl-tRNA hydrolase [bacterium]|nr:aminoacyl-tRNA hydrolase [bacterium]